MREVGSLNGQDRSPGGTPPGRATHFPGLPTSLAHSTFIPDMALPEWLFLTRMRTLYTILFFLDTLVLGCLTYLFLHKLDHCGSVGALVLIFSGIVACIIILVVLLIRYLKQP